MGAVQTMISVIDKVEELREEEEMLVILSPNIFFLFQKPCFSGVVRIWNRVVKAYTTETTIDIKKMKC